MPVVDLVGGDERPGLAAAQLARQLGVAGPQPGAGVDDQHRDVGLGHRRPRLALDVAGQLVLVGEVDAAGVDERRSATPVPLGRRPPCGRG